MWHLFMSAALDAPKLTAVVTIDGHTGRVLRVGDSTRSRFVKFIKDLHTDLFLDEKGMLPAGFKRLLPGLEETLAKIPKP